MVISGALSSFGRELWKEPMVQMLYMVSQPMTYFVAALAMISSTVLVAMISTNSIWEMARTPFLITVVLTRFVLVRESMSRIFRFAVIRLNWKSRWSPGNELGFTRCSIVMAH